MTIPKHTPRVGDVLRRPSWRDDHVAVTAVGENFLLAKWNKTGQEVTFDIKGDWEPVSIADAIDLDPTSYRPSVGDRIKLPFWSRFYEVTAVGRAHLLIDSNGQEESHRINLPWQKAPVVISGVVQDAGGGSIKLIVDRDTASYPNLGAHVTVTVTS